MHRLRFQRSQRPLGPDDAYNQQIAIMIAGVAVLAAIAGFLQVDASGKSAEANRDAQRLAIEASGEESRGRLEVAFEWDNAFRQWSELELLAESAEIDYFDDRAAVRYRTVQDTILNLSELLSNEEYFDPENEDANLAAYEASDYLVSAAVSSEKRAFRADVAGSWGQKADSYVIVLTIIASSLLLLGLSSTVHDIARWLFLAVGGGIAVIAAIWLFVAIIDSPDEHSDSAAEAYARGAGLAHQSLNSEAISAYNDAIEAYPEYGTALYARGNAHTFHGIDLEFDDRPDEAQEEYLNALTDFEAARDAGRDDTGVGWNLGWVEYLTGDLDTAIATDREVLAADPTLIGVRTNLALALLARGEDGDVEKATLEYQIAKDQMLDAARGRRIAIAAEVEHLPKTYWSHLIYLEIAAKDLDSLINRVSGERAWSEAPSADAVNAETVLAAGPALSAELKGLALALEETGDEPPGASIGATISCFGFGETKFDDTTGEVIGTESAKSFPYGTDEVLITFNYAGMESGQDVVYRVYRNGNEQPSLRLRSEWELADLGNAYNRGISYAYGNRFILGSGDYDVEMYIDYHLVESESFSIVREEGDSPLEVEFSDDFSDVGSGWSCQRDGKTLTDYADGGYRISVDQPSLVTWSNPGKNFQDVTIEVDATKQAGSDENAFGVMCRYRDNENYYTLMIGSDGYAEIAVTIFDQTKRLVDGFFDADGVILPGEETNHIRAECIGNELSLYVNDELIATATDDSFGEGDVGLVAGTYDTPGTDVVFDNFSAVEITEEAE